MPPYLLGRIGTVEQEGGAGQRMLQHLHGVDKVKLMATDKVGATDQIGGVDGARAEAQMRGGS